jgi:hypothetical protein
MRQLPTGTVIKRGREAVRQLSLDDAVAAALSPDS